MSLDGITVKKPEEKPYLVTGHNMYMIGSQDGFFPERGEHIPYEMWGVWSPPVKVLNGFWFQINQELVQKADLFEMLPYGAKFLFSKKGVWELERFQFIPQNENGFILETTIWNRSKEKCVFDLRIGIESNLMPTWLSERAGVIDGEDTVFFEEKEQKLIFKDHSNPWTCMMTATESISYIESAVIPIDRRKNKNTCYAEVKSNISLLPDEGKKIMYQFSFSATSEEAADQTMQRLIFNREKLQKEKIEKYKKIEETAVLKYPKKPVFETMYRWSKYINDWIIREVEGIGRGVCAGYAEFPWWFGNDTNYIVPALLMQGEYEICKSTLRLLRDKSEQVNGNGRVVHEISNNGMVYYEGMTTETPQFADTVWMVYQWSGDLEFLTEMYDFCKKGMEWIHSICVDGLPLGYGISEIAGLDCFCCDTALLAIRGYEMLGFMSEALGKKAEAKVYQRRKEEMWELFKKEFYLKEYQLFGDMAAVKEDIIPRAETWKYTLKSFPITEEEKIMGESSCKKDKSPESIQEKKKLQKRMEQVIEKAEQMKDGERKAFYLFGAKHSLIPLEFGYLKGEKGLAILNAVREMERKEHITIEDRMPIGVGREIAAFANVGLFEDIIEDIGYVADGFSAIMPGATSEIYPEKGCFVQAWNSFATMWPYAGSIFGIKPDANQKKIRLTPCLGKEADGITLENLIVGASQFNFSCEIKDETYIITVKRPSKDWNIELDSEIKSIKLMIEE